MFCSLQKSKKYIKLNKGETVSAGGKVGDAAVIRFCYLSLGHSFVRFVLLDRTPSLTCRFTVRYWTDVLRVDAFLQIKTESGAKVNAGNRGMYKRWKERSHMRIATRGDEEAAAGGNGRPSATSGPGRKRKGPLPNANVRDELKGVEEVRKHRQKKVMRQKLAAGGKKGKGGPGAKSGPSPKQKRGSFKGGLGKTQPSFKGNRSTKKG